MDFSVFKNAVAKQFAIMQELPMYRVNIDKDILWDTYLSSHPEGTNPVYRKRTAADCSCCKQFIRAIGNVVALVDSRRVMSIWDINIPEEPAFQAVANALSALVKSGRPVDEFFHYEKTAGTDKNFEQLVEGVKTWQHFFVNIKPQFVLPAADIATRLGEVREIRNVFLRGLETISMDAISTVQELIAQNSLYRGEDHSFAVSAFRKLKVAFSQLNTNEEREAFAWSQAKIAAVSVAKIRNTSIGTLLIDLTEGKDLDAAVASFDKIMAPESYKRTTALITPRMVSDAKAKIEALGLTLALQRRYANIHDITVNNVLFVQREFRNIVDLDVFDNLATATANKKLDKVEEVTIDKFIAGILPHMNSVEVLVENKHAANFVSLIAPSDPTAGQLLKWSNGFSWSYAGEVADSIKERVKQAGGKVEGDLCCRLAWYNHDDLDFHMVEPDGYEIYFGTKNRTSPSGGRLDVDMNAGYGSTRDPVENIYYENKRNMAEGIYTLVVNNYKKRESADVGFEVEIDFMGQMYSFVYEKAVLDGANVVVARMKYSHANGIEILDSIPSTQKSRDLWSLKTQTFVPVNALMLSPNFWDDNAVGNKHWFFMLEGCANEGTVRGFYNEQLKEELMPHRKVFEVLASKMKPEHSDTQLSGLGFSVTQRNSLTCRVKGNFTRTIKIIF